MLKIVKVALCVLTVAVLSASASLAASPQSMVTGLGLTNAGNTLGYNAKSDLTGHYTYVSHDQTFRVMCFRYTFYRLMTDLQGFPEVHVLGTCRDQARRTIYMETYYIDRGEPGVGGPGEGDVARVYFTYNAAFQPNPNEDPNLFLADFSLIMAGNVQILPAQTSQ